MFNKIKKFFSRFTDRPIFKGQGVTTLDILSSAPVEEVNFKISGAKDLFTLERVVCGAEDDSMYYVLQNTKDTTELIMTPEMFDQIASRNVLKK